MQSKAGMQAKTGMESKTIWLNGESTSTRAAGT